MLTSHGWHATRANSAATDEGMRVFDDAAVTGDPGAAALLARVCAEVTSEGSPLADVERSSFAWAGLAWHALHNGDRIALLALPKGSAPCTAAAVPSDADERPIVEQLLRRFGWRHVFHAAPFGLGRSLAVLSHELAATCKALALDLFDWKAHVELEMAVGHDRPDQLRLCVLLRGQRTRHSAWLAECVASLALVRLASGKAPPVAPLKLVADPVAHSSAEHVWHAEDIGLVAGCEYQYELRTSDGAPVLLLCSRSGPARNVLTLQDWRCCGPSLSARTRRPRRCRRIPFG